MSIFKWLERNAITAARMPGAMLADVVLLDSNYTTQVLQDHQHAVEVEELEKALEIVERVKQLEKP